MNRKTLAKRSGLAAALDRGRAADPPEAAQVTQPENQTPAEKPETKTKPAQKRFHTTLYPDPKIYAEIKIALIREGQGRDFNQLVNELITEWLEAHSER